MIDLPGGLIRYNPDFILWRWQTWQMIEVVGFWHDDDTHSYKQTNKHHLLVDQGPCRELSKTMLFRVQSFAQWGLQRLPDHNHNHTVHCRQWWNNAMWFPGQSFWPKSCWRRSSGRYCEGSAIKTDFHIHIYDVVVRFYFVTRRRSSMTWYVLKTRRGSMTWNILKTRRSSYSGSKAGFAASSSVAHLGSDQFHLRFSYMCALQQNLAPDNFHPRITSELHL